MDGELTAFKDSESKEQESCPQTPCSVLSDPFDLADEFSSVVGVTEETGDSTLESIYGWYERASDSSPVKSNSPEAKRMGRVFQTPGPAPATAVSTPSGSPGHLPARLYETPSQARLSSYGDTGELLQLTRSSDLSSPSTTSYEPSPELARGGGYPALSTLHEETEDQVQIANLNNIAVGSSPSLGEQSLRNPFRRLAQESRASQIAPSQSSTAPSERLPENDTAAQQLQFDDSVPSMWRRNSIYRRRASVDDTQAHEGASPARPVSSIYGNGQDGGDWKTLHDLHESNSHGTIIPHPNYTGRPSEDASAYSTLINEQFPDTASTYSGLPGFAAGRTESGIHEDRALDPFTDPQPQNEDEDVDEEPLPSSNRGSTNALSNNPVSPPFTPTHGQMPFSFSSSSDRLSTPSHISNGSRGSANPFLNSATRPSNTYSPSPLPGSNTSRLQGNNDLDTIEPLHPGDEDPEALELRQYPTHKNRDNRKGGKGFFKAEEAPPIPPRDIARSKNPFNRAAQEPKKPPKVLKKEKKPALKGQNSGDEQQQQDNAQSQNHSPKTQVSPLKRVKKALNPLTKHIHFLTPDYSLSDRQLYQRSRFWRIAPTNFRNATDPPDPELALDQIDTHRNESAYASTEQFFQQGDAVLGSGDRRGPHVWGSNNGSSKANKVWQPSAWRKGKDKSTQLARGRFPVRASRRPTTTNGVQAGEGGYIQQLDSAQRIIMDQERLARNLNIFSWVLLGLLVPAYPLLMIYAVGWMDVAFLHISNGIVDGVGARQKAIAKKLGWVSFAGTLCVIVVVAVLLAKRE